jgi:hypothetical protein
MFKRSGREFEEEVQDQRRDINISRFGKIPNANERKK